MRRHANEFLRTNSGRLAGSGVSYDRYDDETTLKTHPPMPDHPIYTKEYVEFLKELKEEQPVKIYKLTEEEMEEYLDEKRTRSKRRD